MAALADGVQSAMPMAFMKFQARFEENCFTQCDRHRGNPEERAPEEQQYPGIMLMPADLPMTCF